jgi:hypothetical protein
MVRMLFMAHTPKFALMHKGYPDLSCDVNVVVGVQNSKTRTTCSRIVAAWYVGSAI